MKYKIILLFIILIAAFFRFYQISTNPPSLTWDEVAWGYNAYSLGIDGKDEFGRFLPHDYLESFGDFKPPMYAYLAILPVKIFGLTEFATRFPSAFCGVLTVLLTYFLVKQIFPKSKYKEWYGLAGSFILAISPWHILLSRAAFEANVATCFLVTGVLLFLYSINEKRWFLPFSIASFVASMYTFNSARIVGPLLVITLSLIFIKQLWKQKLPTIIAIIIGILCILPTAKFLLSKQADLRYQEVNIFSDVELVKTANQEIANDNNSAFSKIIHNRRVIYGLAYMTHYFDNLTPNFLFIHGDGNPKFSIQDVGEMYLWDLPFFIIGILFLFKKKEGHWWIIPIWLLLGIIPAATARETPHALRTEATLPTFQLFIAYGLVQSIIMLKSRITNVQWRKISLGIIFVLLCINVSYFAHQYFIHYPITFSGEWQYGYKDSIAYVQQVQDNYNKIYITDALGRPYIYYLFYTKTDPAEFRASANITRDAFGFVTVNSFGKYFFSSDLRSLPKGNVLYIDYYNRVPSQAKTLKTFNMLDGSPVLVAYTL